MEGMGSKAKDRFYLQKRKQTQITKFNSRRQKDKEVRSVREIGIIQRRLGFFQIFFHLLLFSRLLLFPVCRCTDVYSKVNAR